MRRLLFLAALLLIVPALALGATGAGIKPAKDLYESIGTSGKRYLSAYVYNLYPSSYIEAPEISKPANPSANYGRLYVKDVTGTTSLMFLDSSGTETNLITALAGAGVDVANGVWFGTNAFVMEGATANNFELSLAPADVTADRTATFPDATGTVMLSTLATNAPDAANSVTGASNALVFEGATANNFELSLAPADVTADRTATFPDATGTVMLSTLATNAPDAANSVTGASNALVFEGATANAYEISLAPADATADRTITLPDKTGTVALLQSTVTAKTGNYTVTTADIGQTFSNAGAGGQVIFTLPEASTWIGGRITFVTYAAQNLNISPADASDTLLAITNSAGDSIINSTAGNSITLMALDSTNIVVVSSYGTWTDAN